MTRFVVVDDQSDLVCHRYMDRAGHWHDDPVYLSEAEAKELADKWNSYFGDWSRVKVASWEEIVKEKCEHCGYKKDQHVRTVKNIVNNMLETTCYLKPFDGETCATSRVKVKS